MSKTASLLAPLVAGLIGLLPAPPAQAQVSRTFVSAAGSDSNSCTNVTAPCRHFAAAYAATAAEGEIDVLDPANYGELTISHGISVQGHGWASVSAVTNGAAITITGGDKINISGVILDGAAAANSNGIRFNSAGSLTVRDCVIRNFSNYGILFAPNNSSQLFVSNTQVSDNGYIGISIQSAGPGTTTGVLNHVKVENNASDGLNAGSGLTGTQTINLTVSDSVIAANKGNGIIVQSTGSFPVNVMLRNSTIANNSANGLTAIGTGANIWVTRSAITDNSVGWNSDGLGTVTSYGDNNIDANGSANSEPPNPLTYQ
jgi:hypothetical protein